MFSHILGEILRLEHELRKSRKDLIDASDYIQTLKFVSDGPHYQLIKAFCDEMEEKHAVTFSNMHLLGDETEFEGKVLTTVYKYTQGLVSTTGGTYTIRLEFDNGDSSEFGVITSDDDITAESLKGKLMVMTVKEATYIVTVCE